MDEQIRIGEVVLMDEETATTEAQEGEIVKIEGFKLYNYDPDVPVIFLRKV